MRIGPFVITWACYFKKINELLNEIDDKEAKKSLDLILKEFKRLEDENAQLKARIKELEERT